MVLIFYTLMPVIQAASSFPGYVAHTVIPPSTGLPGANRVHTYLSVLKFASRRDFQRQVHGIHA